jgi:ribosomal protein S18 acetylase RimI-like enzyme
MAQPIRLRAALREEIDALALLWYEGWRDAHEAILPEEFRKDRTLESFRKRLQADLEQVRVVGAPNAPVGFCIVKHDELYQLYVSRTSRGTGVAAALVVDAEERLSRKRVKRAWLACAIGNERAARFYEKCGWQLLGTMISQLDTSNGIYPLEVWRYEKVLTSAHTPERR